MAPIESHCWILHLCQRFLCVFPYFSLVQVLSTEIQPHCVDDLRDSLAGCVGGILSIAATNVRLHISVPEKRWFKIRKVSGTPGAIVSSSGADVDVEVGELRFGERKDLIVEVELSIGGYGDASQSRGREHPIAQEFSATDAFFLAKAGINPSSLDEYDPNNLYEDEYDSMPDEVPLFEVSRNVSDTFPQLHTDTGSTGQCRLPRSCCWKEHLSPQSISLSSHDHDQPSFRRSSFPTTSFFRSRDRSSSHGTPRERYAVASSPPHDSS